MPMKNNDYKIEFEEHRKEIDVLERMNGGKLPSRAERHSKGRKKASSHTVINVILGVFTFIPIMIFVYVIYNFYFGTDSSSASVGDSNVRLEIDTNTPNYQDPTDKAVGVADDDNKEDDKEDKKNVTGNNNSGQGTVQEKNNNDSKSTQVDQKTEPKKIDQKAEKEPSKESIKEPVKKQEEKKPDPPKNTGKTHIVRQNETLYRISVNYYGSDKGIDKIKQANGLTSNEIRVGQKLIIP